MVEGVHAGGLNLDKELQATTEGWEPDKQCLPELSQTKWSVLKP